MARVLEHTYMDPQGYMVTITRLVPDRVLVTRGNAGEPGTSIELRVDPDLSWPWAVEGWVRAALAEMARKEA